MQHGFFTVNELRDQVLYIFKTRLDAIVLKLNVLLLLEYTPLA
jgi:hypothetical protein